jgi:hypothetical protein
MIQFIHSYWAYLLILLFVATLAKYLLGFISRKVFDFNTDYRLASFTIIVFDIQIILGLINWFVSPYFSGIRSGHMGEYMKNAHDRLLVLEHPVMMLIALLLIHYGFRRMKNAIGSQKKYMAVLLTYGIAFFLVLLRIPWKIWL